MGRAPHDEAGCTPLGAEGGQQCGGLPGRPGRPIQNKGNFSSGGNTMSMTGLETFDTTLHKTNDWINRLGDLLGWEDKQKSYMVLKTTLQALRDRITVEEVAQLGAQLPMLIRGFYYEGWKPADTPLNVRNRAQFLARIIE